MGTYFLFLDDVRYPKGASIAGVSLEQVSGIGNVQWTIARSFEQFVQIVEGKGVPEVVSLDHDLSEDHMKEAVGKGFENFDYIRFRDTGYDAARWLCMYCKENGLPFPKWYVHSFNPVGSENIKKFILNFPHYGTK